MNFDFSDEQKLLREQARRLLAERCSSQVVRAVLENDSGYDPGLWKNIAEILRNIIAERVLGLPPDIRVDKDIPFDGIPTGQRKA